MVLDWNLDKSAMQRFTTMDLCCAFRRRKVIKRNFSFGEAGFPAAPAGQSRPPRPAEKAKQWLSTGQDFQTRPGIKKNQKLSKMKMQLNLIEC